MRTPHRLDPEASGPEDQAERASSDHRPGGPTRIDEPVHVDRLVERARALATAGSRRMLGIVGAPGAGKSTVAAAVVAALGDQVARDVPMDGFHLANTELERLGLRDRKGAPETFDAAGYVALLRRLREPTGVVYAPQFRREIEEPVAGAIAVPPEVPLVVTEGNYLLLTTPPWSAVRDLLDEVWFLDPPTADRHARLIRRHEAYGKSPAAARAWALGSDERNADLIRPTAARADVVISGTVVGVN